MSSRDRFSHSCGPLLVGVVFGWGAIRARPRTRSGFTLVELLVVIAIIGLLVALLLPAIQSARAASRKSTCLNNLRTLSQGLLLYENAKKEFPPGALCRGTFGVRDKGVFTWSAFLLPFIGESALYDAVQPWVGAPCDPNYNGVNLSEAGDVAALAVAATQLSVFRCPEDSGPTTCTDPAQTDLKNDYLLDVAVSNYVAAMRAVSTPSTQTAWTSLSDPTHGGFMVNTKVKMKNVTDGTSKSIAIGERVWMFRGSTSTVKNYAAAWVGSAFADKDSQVCFQATFAPGAQINGGQRSHRTMSSNHPSGGVNVGMFDGSATFISDNIDHYVPSKTDQGVDSVLEYLIAIADGIAITKDY